MNSEKKTRPSRERVTFRFHKDKAEMRFARNNRKSVTIRLDAGLAGQVSEAARRMGVSDSDLYNMAVVVFLKRIKI